MRNLRNIRHSRFKFNAPESSRLTATAWDATDDSIILAFGPTEDNPAITLKRLPHDSRNPSDTNAIASWDAPSPNPELAVDRIVDLHCFPDSKTVSLVLVGGDIIVVREEPKPGEDLIEIVGSVDAGISAAAWSPDEELLAVSTAAETLLFMTRDFESTANLSLSPDDVKVSTHVSVGWGKKETQFKGRGVAKTLRDPTIPEHVDEGALSPLDDDSVTISWRGDGQYVAVNSILETEQRRRIIRVYSREGKLESVSEPINGLEGALSWKPSGQVIAGIQRHDGKIDVVFFERNGLRHGEFSLRLDEQELVTIGSNIKLKWNVDCTVLAVSMKDRVQLWTMSSYNYYLKQEIRLDRARSSASTIWHPEKALYLSCTNDCDLRSLAYKFEVCRGSVSPPNDFGTVAVIDGQRLQVTPLRIANIPPPMAFDEIELPLHALDVTIDETGTEIAVLHNHSISLWSCDYSLKPVMKASFKSIIEIPTTETNSDSKGEEFGRNGYIKISGSQRLYARTDHDRIFYFQQENGISGIDVDLGGLSAGGPDLTDLVWRSTTGDEISFHLSESGILQVQSPRQTLRIGSCTSFIVTPMHLVYTTGQHLLKFVHLHGKELEVPSEEPEKDERCRRIERGARIVTIIPSACSLVLQMPRGNLETIYPRALVLAGVRESIRNKDYKKALLTCRTHRVDMNILHDYMPEQFMCNVEGFVKQVGTTEYMDLFLSSLSEDNVSETIYRDTLGPSDKPVVNGTLVENPGQISSLGRSKVNKVCDAILQVLQKQSPPRLQNIVTAHVCKNPPDLEAGLKLLSNLSLEKDQESLEQAVEHICFLADVNQLYDSALGIYDLDVALLVAQQSQKDPREYLPYLQKLHDMEPVRRQFSIDDDLKRHSKAISHLHALEDFEAVTSYMRKHHLYSTAINLYRYDNLRLIKLMRLYADYLSSQNRFNEAGVAYEYISDHSSAAEAFRAANMWQECLANAMLVPVAAGKLCSIAEDLANALEEAKDFRSSAVIHLDYLKDVEGAAKLLCKGYDFGDAIRQVTLHQKSELLINVIDAGLIDASATTMELLADMKSQLGAQVPRLLDLRQKKADDPVAFLDGADGGDADIPDNLSLAPTDASTSGNTFMTRYTNRSTATLATNATRKTSKNKRREERKRARGKKGTVYEEEYLVNSVARLVERLNDVGGDIAKLVQGLMRRSMRERAVAVQVAAEEVANICRDSMAEVFPARMEVNTHETYESTSEKAQIRPWGGQGVLWDAERSLNSPWRDPPVLKQFERLALLD